MLTFYVATSLDGYIATDTGDVDWLESFQSKDYGFERFYKDVQVVIMGANTFEKALFLGPWPYKNKKTYVFAHRKVTAKPDKNITITADDPVKVIKTIAKSGKKNLWLVGGGELAASLVESKLIDELDIFIMPILLGSGRKLFISHEVMTNLKLTNHKVFKNGAVQLQYKVGKGKSSRSNKSRKSSKR